MTLSSRKAFNFYMKGAEANLAYRVVPMDVLGIANGLEIIYTYCHRRDPDVAYDVYFAIGKVKET